MVLDSGKMTAYYSGVGGSGVLLCMRMGEKSEKSACSSDGSWPRVVVVDEGRDPW